MQHGRRHGEYGSDPIPSATDWCMAAAGGTIPGDNAQHLLDLELAFGSGVDSGLYTQVNSAGVDQIQINGPGTFEVHWTASWTGTISSPSEGQEVQGQCLVNGGWATNIMGFGGLPSSGQERLRSSGSDYANLHSTGGLLHWPTNSDTPPTFAPSLVEASTRQNTGSNLSLEFWVYIRRVDKYMLSSTDAFAWGP